MNVVGIIAEYNPFHQGHRFHLEQARRLTGASLTVVAMSGNYVQRGVPAMFDKYTRAKAALSNGADLVLELPLQTATGSAEYFASGAVRLLAGTSSPISVSEANAQTPPPSGIWQTCWPGSRTGTGAC